MLWSWIIEKVGLKGLLLTLGTLALGLTIFLAWRHYAGLLDETNVLRVNASKLEQAVDSQTQTINAQQKALAEWKANQEKMASLIEESLRVSKNADQELRRLNALFIDHDLGLLAAKKPGLLQTRINAGTDNARRLLECASGASSSNCSGTNRETDKTKSSTP
jgi:hypothetical protein